MLAIPVMVIGASSNRSLARRSFLHRHRPVEHREAQRRAADPYQVVVLQVAARQADAVDERAVPAGEVLDGVLVLADDDDRGVLARYLLVLQDDVALLASDRVGADAGEVERLPLELSLDHREMDRFTAQRRRLAQHALRGALESRLVDGAGPSAGHTDRIHRAGRGPPR